MVANMIRHWEEVINVIQSEPRGIYFGEDVWKYPFFNVKQVCQRGHVSPHLSKSWINDMSKGFRQAIITQYINAVQINVQESEKMNDVDDFGEDKDDDENAHE